MPPPRPAWPRMRYRRSLASRVIGLTTLAVGLSVALVALAANLTVRAQMQSSMDESLHRRAYVVAQYDLNEYTVRDIPAFMLGAADVKVGYITSDRQIVTTRGPDKDAITLGAPELAVARGTSDYSCRTVPSRSGDYRVATAPTGTDGVAVVVAQSMAANRSTLDKLGLVLAIFGIAGVIAAALAGWGVARNGLRPVRRLTHAAEDGIAFIVAQSIQANEVALD